MPSIQPYKPWRKLPTNGEPFMLSRRLIDREVGSNANDRFSQIRGIYADYSFVSRLDIVNELTGFTPGPFDPFRESRCVNALNWSSSGEYLVAGGDDKTVQIYEYLPASSTEQFNRVAGFPTGHAYNIFAVKFMPYSNNTKIVTASLDSKVIVLDLKHDCPRDHAQVFECHSKAVKRIVTQDSPWHFMTCSEDGTVRQWDLRDPASAYPSPYNGDPPDPLISYAGYNMELSTLSSSPRQSQYIAVGGDHLHCFLHDRRMIGRDKLRERGGLLGVSGSPDTTALEAATRCVRKFAPGGRSDMTKSDYRDGVEITSCKISDANPNELIVSWSGGDIYSFDILGNPRSTKPQDSPGLTAAEDENDLAIQDPEGNKVENGENHSENWEGMDTEDSDDLSDSDNYFWFEPARLSADKTVPCSAHSRVYSGHANVQTAKDVNYFGLQDDYVVSGSDCGHIFIWDRKSSKVVNILHGDKEIVNVVEGHPYEPILAVSGIDSTIKIFSADARERKKACLGIGIQAKFEDRGEIPEKPRPLQMRFGLSWIGEGDEQHFEDHLLIGSREGLQSRRRMRAAPSITTENRGD